MDLLDIDLCLSCFQRVHSVLTRLKSPNTVDRNSDNNSCSTNSNNSLSDAEKAQGSGSPLSVDTPQIDHVGQNDLSKMISINAKQCKNDVSCKMHINHDGNNVDEDIDLDAMEQDEDDENDEDDNNVKDKNTGTEDASLQRPKAVQGFIFEGSF